MPHQVRRSTPVVMDGRFYNPWNTDAAMKSFTDLVNVRFNIMLESIDVM
jgi:hypothetical protein